MKTEIKQRIAKLNNGEIPNGYKKTSVGIVPIEWAEHTLGDIFKFKNGLNKEKEAFGQGTPIVNYTDVWKKRGLKAKDIKGRVVLSKNEIQNYEAKCGDVFFTRTSETIDEIGYSSVLLEDIENAVFSGFVLRARPYNNLVSREYHQYCYSEPLMRQEIIKRSSMTTRALTSGPMLSQVAINLPSHREQSKIAEILMKWDEAIELYNQYIEKLKQLKSIWLKKMFPKKGERVPEWRFKGFTDAWEQRKLGEMGQTYTGLSGKTKGDFGHGQARFVTYMNVFSNPISNPEMTEPIEIDSKQNEVEVGDVFFTTSSETPEEVGMSSILLEKRGKTYLNSFCFGFRPSEKIDSYYLAYMLRSESARAKITLLAQGISRYNISKNKVMEIAVSLPSLDEQKMIGQYFSQLDNLITLHQCKVEKIKAQQKVLQKYLLNGIVRV